MLINFKMHLLIAVGSLAVTFSSPSYADNTVECNVGAGTASIECGVGATAAGAESTAVGEEAAARTAQSR